MDDGHRPFFRGRGQVGSGRGGQGFRGGRGGGSSRGASWGRGGEGGRGFHQRGGFSGRGTAGAAHSSNTRQGSDLEPKRPRLERHEATQSAKQERDTEEHHDDEIARDAIPAKVKRTESSAAAPSPAHERGATETSEGLGDNDAQPVQPTGELRASGIGFGGFIPRKVNHTFKTNYLDHFETQTDALRHIVPVLEELRQVTRPGNPEKMVLYDPYYCTGAVVDAWKELGFNHVIHENRDFYADVACKTVPSGYDILVTNPPFSEDHIERLFRFLTRAPAKPWAVLMPDYVASKDWYKRLIEDRFDPAAVILPHGYNPPKHSSAAGALLLGEDGNPKPKLGVEPFYVVPKAKYNFMHPHGVGRGASHFRTMWYVHAGRRTNELCRAAKAQLIGNDEVTVVHGLAALDAGHHVQVGQRLNPKARAAIKNKKFAGGGGGKRW